MENTNKKEDWETRFIDAFDFGPDIRQQTQRGIQAKNIIAFIRSLLEKSSLKGERNRLMAEMKQEARRELVEELEGKIKEIIDSHYAPINGSGDLKRRIFALLS